MNIHDDSIGVSVDGANVGSSETAEIKNICETKLVEESETMNIRYSPLCRQVGES